jgi:SAM-dependent methyltransferase
MFDFHGNKEVYFNYQYLTARDHILPFIAQEKPQEEMGTVLEIGCGEAGVLKAFVEIGSRCIGIELSPGRVKTAELLHAEALAAGQISFLARNIYDIDPDQDLPFKFDLIILKDVIEHIPDQERFIPLLKSFLNPSGVIFFGFPPWQMPFGGHQQICRSRILSRWPYLHLLPRRFYKALLNWSDEPENRQKGLMEIRDTGISIERFERIIRNAGMSVVARTYWLLNPIYQYKFGKGPYRQLSLIRSIPWIRNFLTTAVYYVIRP